MQQPSSVVHSKLQLRHTTSKNTKKTQVFTSMFWWKIATCMHFQCQGRHMQSASPTLGRGFHTPDSEGGADFWCTMPPAHINCGCMCRLESITKASSQAMVWPHIRLQQLIHLQGCLRKIIRIIVLWFCTIRLLVARRLQSAVHCRGQN